MTPLTDQHDQGPRTACPDPELFASYIDGLATSRERSDIESHVATCEDCYFVLSETIHEQRRRWPAEDERDRTSRQAWIRWTAAGLAVAAALVLALRVAGPFRRVPQQESITASRPAPVPPVVPGNLAPAPPQLEALTAAVVTLDASTGPFRPLQPRLAAGSEYRPLKPVVRSAVSTEEMPEAVRANALAVAKLAAASGPSAAVQRALAEMYLTTGKPDLAVKILEPLSASSADALLLTDLAAAYLARGGPDDAAKARDAAEQAVERDPKRSEAWFNLALAAEALDLPVRATEAWTRFLEIDGTSAWAGEARQHLDRLNRRTRR